MGRVITIALFVVIFLIGLSVLLYPAIGDYYNSQKHVQAVGEYFEAVQNLSEVDYTNILEAAREYNERLRRMPNRFNMTDDERSEYNSLLDPSGRGAMGTLEIEVIDIHLPIYHGTDEGVLQIGLGHLEGSSLPVGGLGTHAAITGHRGLPSSTLLTNLDRVVIGDTFKLHILGMTLEYKVDQFSTVLPNETASLAIVADADYCTLVTCTPYGINTHRLLVRGYRIAGSDGEEIVRPALVPTEAHILHDARAALLIFVPVTLAVLVVLFIRLRRVYGRGKKR